MTGDSILNVSESAAATYRGAPVPANFGDARVEYLALREAAGVFAMPWRAKLAITGSDRVRWLNGMVTNNIRDLPQDHGAYAFLLTAQGRIIGDMDIFQRGEYLLVVSDATQIDAIATTFDHFIIMDDVELNKITEKLSAIGLAGPAARGVLSRTGIDVPQLDPLQLIDVTWQDIGITVVRGGNSTFESYEIWLSPEKAHGLHEALRLAGATPVGYEALEMFRISMGVPAYGIDIRERDLPQETGQSQALHFAKGCYVGQEIIERIRARGNVHRGFAGFIVAGAAPAPGTRIQLGGKDVGEITSAAKLPANDGEKTVALGYLRREAGGPGSEVKVGDAIAQVSTLPFQL